jgi:DNA-binding MarR family transcriptional regulator
MNIFDFDNSINFLVNKTAQKFKVELSRRLKSSGYDLSSDQWSVLMAVSKQDGSSQTDLANKLYKDRANITRILDVLEKQLLIERRRSNIDRREYNVHMTESGKKIIPALKKEGKFIINKALQGANEDDIIIMKSFLNKMFNNLED